jgi:hypothetical protein
MPRAPDRDGIDIGQHMATLNLFREADGTFWLTVAHAGPAVAEAARRADGTVPMNVVAEWVEEAAARFIQSWKTYRHSSRKC